MTTGFCGNCGAPRVAGAAFCSSCGAPTAVSPPVQPPPQMPPQQSYAPAPPYAGQPPAAPRGMSSNAKIGIVIALLAAVVIGYFVWKNEQEFQRNRRAARTPVATAPQQPATPAAPAQQGGAAPAPYGGYDSGGTPGSAEWARNQLIGRWGMRDCVTTTAFRADGTTFSTNGTQSLSGTWTYQHPNLTVVEPGGTTRLEIVEMGDLEMRTESQGRQQRWRRC